jgi:hypothetical protein
MVVIPEHQEAIAGDGVSMRNPFITISSFILGFRFIR